MFTFAIISCLFKQIDVSNAMAPMIAMMDRMKLVAWAVNLLVALATNSNAATAHAFPFNGNATWNKVICVSVAFNFLCLIQCKSINPL